MNVCVSVYVCYVSVRVYVTACVLCERGESCPGPCHSSSTANRFTLTPDPHPLDPCPLDSQGNVPCRCLGSFYVEVGVTGDGPCQGGRGRTSGVEPRRRRGEAPGARLGVRTGSGRTEKEGEGGMDRSDRRRNHCEIEGRGGCTIEAVPSPLSTPRLCVHPHGPLPVSCVPTCREPVVLQGLGLVDSKGLTVGARKCIPLTPRSLSLECDPVVRPVVFPGPVV